MKQNINWTPSCATDIRKTWARFGWKPINTADAPPPPTVTMTNLKKPKTGKDHE